MVSQEAAVETGISDKAAPGLADEGRAGEGRRKRREACRISRRRSSLSGKDVGAGEARHPPSPLPPLELRKAAARRRRRGSGRPGHLTCCRFGEGRKPRRAPASDRGCGGEGQGRGGASGLGKGQESLLRSWPTCQNRKGQLLNLEVCVRINSHGPCIWPRAWAEFAASFGRG